MINASFPLSFFVEMFEAVAWTFSSDDAEADTTFFTGDSRLSVRAEPAPSLVSENWEVIHLVIADIGHGS